LIANSGINAGRGTVAVWSSVGNGGKESVLCSAAVALLDDKRSARITVAGIHVLCPGAKLRIPMVRIGAVAIGGSTLRPGNEGDVNLLQIFGEGHSVLPHSPTCTDDGEPSSPEVGLVATIPDVGSFVDFHWIDSGDGRR